MQGGLTKCELLGSEWHKIKSPEKYKNVIQALLGHIDVNTTRKPYVHVSEAKKKEVANLLDNFLD
ncbi:recombinase-like protein [Clostridium kluyveri]|uniref:Recombinase-related protein n=1 Tax=Clostridium kluyveri (strain ATCC 8527 / DSM 555 / NBRC 12016 / NCIMB 10680 / K1) TaxID=431943 RepID=A5N470_CLOK5|nr:recombinase-like protein [Clostridium kluyveri]EDK32101.1 Recombinase-related protein [Clostridium kluyveri DSM 555]